MNNATCKHHGHMYSDTRTGKDVRHGQKIALARLMHGISLPCHHHACIMPLQVLLGRLQASSLAGSPMSLASEAVAIGPDGGCSKSLHMQCKFCCHPDASPKCKQKDNAKSKTEALRSKKEDFTCFGQPTRLLKCA